MVRRTSIRDAILKGVQDANRQYEAWSRGMWVTDTGVEGHVVSTVAGKLHPLINGRGSIEMEVPFRTIQEWSGAGRPRGRPRLTMNPQNRADIVMFRSDWRPVCVIEVKRYWQDDGCLRDLERVRDLLLACGRQGNGSLRMGFLTFLLVGWEGNGVTAERRLERRKQGIETVLDESFDGDGLKQEFGMSAIRRYPASYRNLLNERNWVHRAVCIGLWSGQASGRRPGDEPRRA